jgi:hypothetical protein
VPQSNDIVKLGTAILEPIIKGYKAGGAALALILVGTVLLLAAVIAGQSVTAYVAAAAGAATILVVLARFYFVELQDAKRAAKTIRDNEALLNAIQDTAIQLTDICASLQTLAFKHSDKVRPLLKNVRETIRLVGDVPILGKSELGIKITALAEHRKFQEVDDLSAAIVETTEGAKKVIDDLRSALTSLDAKPLIGYSRQLTTLKTRLTELLKRAA